MTNVNEVYKCDLCGNIVRVVHAGFGQLACCGEPMQLVTERTSVNEGLEKHVPVPEEETGVLTVKIGSVEHPMTREHYIEWVEVQEDKISLLPGSNSQVSQ
jgi:superoxide reductase